MSRFRGKRKEDYASEGDSEGQAPSKKASKKDSSDESTEDIVVCEISKNRRVTVRNWQGRAVVDIREFYVKDGKQLPGKKGPYSSSLSHFLMINASSLITWFCCISLKH
ncbi:hypothetical protein I3842_04G079500 [Carya illinoinensis]|uniref:Transcriptional coactivator p15 (PC4) C-terminal domain-containing protein n=1 Tax=Carya illinoinensis TaxID=32201 RepID=A0A922F6V7_CARIL|nr:hypothetical protein I3842_04G079500 [Carya illinoinensis]